MDEFEQVGSSMFEENMLTLYAYGRKVMLLYRAATGDDKDPLPPEDFADVPADLRAEWIMAAGTVSPRLTHLVAQVGAEMARREPGDA